MNYLFALILLSSSLQADVTSTANDIPKYVSPVTGANEQFIPGFKPHAPSKTLSNKCGNWMWTSEIWDDYASLIKDLNVMSASKNIKNIQITPLFTNLQNQTLQYCVFYQYRICEEEENHASK